MKLNISKSGDINRQSQKSLEEEWITIYVSEEQHLPYWQLINKRGKVVILPQTVLRLSPMHHKICIYFYNMHYYAILKEHLQLFHKLHPKYFQISQKNYQCWFFSLVEIEAYFPMRIVLYTDIEMSSIKRNKTGKKLKHKKHLL